MRETNLESRKISILGKTLSVHGYGTDGYFRHITEDAMADADILALASLLVPEDGVVLDVGGNIGYETLFFARLAPKGIIHTFEPVPSNVSIIKSNVKSNKLSNVVIHNYGLGDKDLKTQIVYNEGNRGGATVRSSNSPLEMYGISENIVIKVLDKLTAKDLSMSKCDLIKVDIEGFEPAFLRGAEKYINKYKPAMIVEANAWCLDGLQNITLTTFLDQLGAIYPYMAAFDGHDWVDVRKDRARFLHDNLVFRRFQNVYCDFSDRYEEVIAKHQWGWERLGQFNSAIKESHDTIARLEGEIAALRAENELIKRSRPYQAGQTIRKFIK